MRDLFLPGDTPRIALMRLQGMQVDDRSEDAVEWVINNHGLEE